MFLNGSFVPRSESCGPRSLAHALSEAVGKGVLALASLGEWFKVFPSLDMSLKPWCHSAW